MNAVLAIKPLAQLTAQYGPMRTVLNSSAPTDVPREQADVYRFNILGGKGKRESVVNGADGKPVLIIRFVEYIDPVTQRTRYGVDYWSVLRYWASDHETGAMAELSYEKAVRDEVRLTRLQLAPERFTRGVASFYDVTDVI
ncbi:hypothetical protein ACFYZ0_18060 [Streptomyces sp. NPDC001708]|uniref:hypothetical protein n=1 Tax=Streptomyces sp. NPDC001708 TaxID=3364602 RepID=UPI00368C3364